MSTSREAPSELCEFGPICAHNEPTILRTLNGRNVYVCSKYPHHHCGKWCPADFMLLSQLDSSSNKQPAEDQPTASRDLMQTASPEPELAASPPVNDSNDALEEQEPMAVSPVTQQPTIQTMNVGGSNAPTSQHVSSPSLPAAPSKSQSHGSVTSRIPSNVRRSLNPLFNQYAPAALRANMLGGRFVTLRPQAHAIVKMQRRMSGKLSGDIDAALQGDVASSSANAAVVSSGKVLTSPGTTVDSGRAGVPKRLKIDRESAGLSVNTVSLGREPPLQSKMTSLARGDSKDKNSHRFLRRL